MALVGTKCGFRHFDFFLGGELSGVSGHPNSRKREPMPLDADRLQKPVRKLRKFMKKMPRRPTPDEVHNLRTNTRHVEASMEALSLDSKRQGQCLLKDLARLRRRAGKARDMDVLTGFASNVHAK